MVDKISNINFSKLEIVQTGTIDITKSASSSSGIGTVSHNLGYIPVSIVYVNDSGLYNLMPYIIVSSSTGVISEIDYFSIDSTDLAIQIVAPNWVGNGAYTNAYTRQFKYYLFREISSQ